MCGQSTNILLLQRDGRRSGHDQNFQSQRDPSHPFYQIYTLDHEEGRSSTVRGDSLIFRRNFELAFNQFVQAIDRF